MKRLLASAVIALVAGCRDDTASRAAPSPQRAVDAAALIDAAPPIDAAPSVDAAPPVNAIPIDAAPPPRRPPSKAERRRRCLEECERRNRSRDCADAEGLTSCPCRCP